MASLHTIQYFKQFEHLFKPPYLEIGSLIQASYAQHSPRDMQTLQTTDEYIGIDIFEGEGVDLVFNLATASKEDLQHWKEKFNTVHAHYVFEHVTDIFKLAENIDYITKPGGVICFSAPFAWRIHRIPIDMWRFTPQSVDWLFSNYAFDKDHSAWSSRNNYIYPIDQIVELGLGSGLNELNPVFKVFIKLFRYLKLDNTFFQERALLPELNVMMIGVKQPKPTYSFIEESLI
jgi:SAM-dependent methyltransferase